ncbi:hypothetical protein H0H93_005910 [Arthromyces matolae]|nr:hypothetical protein H0H93_005910 [Arthromyces matolae]
METQASRKFLRVLTGVFIVNFARQIVLKQSSTTLIVEHDAETVNYPDNQTILTTLPPRHHTQAIPIGVNNWAECIFTSGRQKFSILSIPGFPHPVPYFNPPHYRTGPSKHGQGMFSTCNLKPGDIPTSGTASVRTVFSNAQ